MSQRMRQYRVQHQLAGSDSCDESLKFLRIGNEFLQIVSDPLRYGWFQPFSALILAIDDTLDVKDDDETEIATPEELFERARELLLPPKADTPFGRRYVSLLQKEPELVIAHAAVVKLLR